MWTMIIADQHAQQRLPILYFEGEHIEATMAIVMPWAASFHRVFDFMMMAGSWFLVSARVFHWCVFVRGHSLFIFVICCQFLQIYMFFNQLSFYNTI